MFVKERQQRKSRKSYMKKDMMLHLKKRQKLLKSIQMFNDPDSSILNKNTSATQI